MGEKTTIWSVYNTGKIDKIWEKLGEWEYLEEGNMVIGGDFNIRIANKGKFPGNEEEDEVSERVSKDKVISNGGNQMINFIENKGWIILNGFARGDEEGEYTFIGARGSS